MTTIVTRQGKGSALTYEEMDSNLSNLKTDVESTQANVTAANARIQTLDANLGTISTTVTALESNAAGQANQITGANAAIVTANTALKNYVDGQVSTLSANAGSQQTTINTNTADITDLRANITAANAVIATKTTAGYVDSAISTAVNNLINSAPGTLDTLGEIAANLATNADTVGAIVNSITSTNANVTAANARIATLDANLGSATTNITTLFANAATQSTDISTLSANAASQTTALQVLDANLGTATTNITALQGNAGTQQTTITTHTGQIATLDANLGTATTNITALQGNASTQQTTINTHTSQIATLDANLGTATTNITTLSANAATQQTTLNGLGTMSTQNANGVAITGGNVSVYNSTATNRFVGTNFDASGSGGGSLRNSGQTALIQWGAGGGTNIALNGATNINPANAQVSISPTGTGSVDIKPEGHLDISPTTVGFMNNVAIGNATPTSGIFTTLQTSGNITANAGAYFVGDGSKLSGITAGTTYTDANVAAYLPTYNGNIQLKNITTGVSENLHIKAGTAADIYIEGAPGGGSDIFLKTYNGEIDIRTTDNYAVTLVSEALINLLAPNVVTNGKFTSTLGYFWANGTPYSTGSGGGTYSDANVAAYLTTQNISSANIGGSQTYANTQIQAISANIGSFYTYANATYSTGGGSTYGNANVAAYLPVYGGSITAYGVTGASGLDLTLQAASAKDIRILGADGGYSDIVLQTSQGEIVIDASSGFGSYGATMKSAALISLLAPNVYTTGQFTSSGGYFWANGTAYSTSTSSYGNTEVAQYLPTYTGGLNGSLRSGNVYSTTNATITGGTGVFVASGATANVYITGDSYIDLTGQSGIVINNTPRIDVHDGNLNVYKNTSTNANGSIYSDNNIRAGGNVIAPNFTFANGVNILSTVSGYIFSGDLAGNILYDSTNGRILANAFPDSTGQITIPNNQTSKLYVNKPTYTSGVLQQPPLANATPGGTGIVSTSSQTISLISTANVGLQSGYGFGSQNRDTIGSVFGLTVTPVTANSMAAQDRVRGALGSLDVVMTGQNWGVMSTAGQNQNTVSAINGASNFNGYGNLASIVGGTYGSFITPAAAQTANIQYATAVLGFLNLLTTAGTTGKANVVYSRGVAPFITGFSSNLTVQNAVGLHTYSGWAGSGAVGTANNPVTGRWAVLNEDANTAIQSNGNITFSNAGPVGSTFTVNSRFANIASTTNFTGTVNFTTAPTGLIGKANTAFAAGFGTATTITGLNLAATISNGNIAQIGPNTGSITYSATTTEIINGAQTVRSVTGNTMSGFQSITPTNAPLDNLGDTLVAIVTDTTNSIVYRITYVKTSLSSGGGSPFGGVTIERLI